MKRLMILLMVVLSTYLYSMKFLSDLILYSETTTEDVPVEPGDDRRELYTPKNI